MIEVEKKYLVTKDEFLKIKKQIERLDNVNEHKIVDEKNILYRGNNLAETSALRLRRVIDESGDISFLLTFKEPLSEFNGIKRKLELETIFQGEEIFEILEKLGYNPSVVYEKNRETFKFDHIEVCFDELAFGYFIELEGYATAIRSLEKILLLQDKGENRSYPALTTEYGCLMDDGTYDACFVKF